MKEDKIVEKINDLILEHLIYYKRSNEKGNKTLLNNISKNILKIREDLVKALYSLD